MTTATYSLIGDIGGTNARFALVRDGWAGQVTPEAVAVLACIDYGNIGSAISDYLRMVGTNAAQVQGA
jgi:glucokinase